MLRIFIRATRSGSRRRRSRQEIESERQRLRAEYDRAIDAIVSEAHALLPRNMATSIGAAYARYSSDFQHSVPDQIRTIFEAAIKLGIFIPRQHVYYDMAIPGCKERRPGLDRVRDILKRKAVQILMVFTTNRLYRKMYRCMRFVEEEIVERGLRCIFIKSNIDTADGDRWRLPLQIYGMLDELSSTMYADNIRAAHEGLFIQRYVVSTLPFGYCGQDVPGQLTRANRSRQLIVIDPETAQWVKMIFGWFVEDRLKMVRIVERLNQSGAPLSPMSNGFNWTQLAVRYLLENSCYRGAAAV